MKNKDKFRIYLDIAIFLLFGVICCMEMLISIINNQPGMEYVLVFIYVYLLNLLFNKICNEIVHTKFFITGTVADLTMSFLCAICGISTLMHVAYLLYFCMLALNDLSIAEILTNHVTYATIVGSIFIIYMAVDNINNFNKLYMKK